MPRLRSSLGTARRSLLFPVLARLDGTDARIASLEAQVTELARALGEMRDDVERTAARAAAVFELVGETRVADLAQRGGEIGRSLGSGG